MPRIRGWGADEPPTEKGREVILNERLFGANHIGGHHVAPRPEALPLDWREVFGRDAPRTLEIGFNRGKFLRGLAERWPDHDHVGVEVRRRYCWRLANEVGEAGAPANLRVVWADAKAVVPAIFAPGSLQATFVTFPDPWWKRRHAKRRLVDVTFASEMAALLTTGGRVWVKSDVPAIAAEISEALRSCASLEGPTPFEMDELPLTYRETRCVKDGLPIERFFFTKI